MLFSKIKTKFSENCSEFLEPYFYFMLHFILFLFPLGSIKFSKSDSELKQLFWFLPNFLPNFFHPFLEPVILNQWGSGSCPRTQRAKEKGTPRKTPWMGQQTVSAKCGYRSGHIRRQMRTGSFITYRNIQQILPSRLRGVGGSPLTQFGRRPVFLAAASLGESTGEWNEIQALNTSQLWRGLEGSH